MIGKTGTKVAVKDSTISVKYHSTEVVRVEGNQVTLKTGGWFTATTKKRMNQASQEFNLGFTVFQSKGEWFVEVGREVLNFDFGNHYITFTIPR